MNINTKIRYSRNNNFKTYNLFTGKEYNFDNKIPYEERLSQLDLILDDAILQFNDANYSFDKTVITIQNDSNVVKKITKDNVNDKFENVDGLITDLTDVALCTTEADALAILLYDCNKKIIGNIHCGWRGTLNKIIVNAINIMVNDYNSNTNDIKVCIYPCILKCCFEVDKDVFDMFNNNFTDINDFIKYEKENNKYHIDLVGINVNEMLKLGLNKDNIISSDICTKCNNMNYYSYRVDKDKCGRHMSIIWKK